MTYRVTGRRGRLLSWGSRRQKRERSHHRKSYSPHETSLSILENECGSMLDPAPMVNPLSFSPLASRNAVVAGDEWQRHLSTSLRPHSSLLPNRVSAGLGFEPFARIGVRNSLHQFADLHLQELIRDDQRSHGIARVAAAGRDRLVGRHLQPIRFRDWLALRIGCHLAPVDRSNPEYCSSFVLVVNLFCRVLTTSILSLVAC